MNNQIRKIFVIVLLMFALLGVGVTNTQFISASSLNEDPRNQRTVLHAAETDRGPIIVDKTAIASSELEDGSKRYARSYSEGPLYAPRHRLLLVRGATRRRASRPPRRTCWTASPRRSSGSACVTS